MAEAEKLCRLCAVKADTFVGIYDEEGCKLNLELKISKYLQIQVCVRDPLPKWVCVDCCAKLDHCSVFHEASLQAQLTLQMIYPMTRMDVQEGVGKLSSIMEDNSLIKFNNIEQSKPNEEQGTVFQLMNLESDPPDYVECVLSDTRNIEKTSVTINDISSSAVMPEEKCHVVSTLCSSDNNENRQVQEELNNVELEDEMKFDEDLFIDDSNTLSKSESNVSSPRKRRDGWHKYPWMCTDCGNELPSLQALRIHHQSVHNQSPRYVCAQCNKVYTKYYGFVSHVRRHKNFMKFCCEECGKCFSNKKVLESHRATHSDARPYICAVCGKSFRQQSALYVHHRSHQPDDVKNKYPCTQCDKRFSTKPNLVTHMRIHTGIRNFTCDQCGKSFVQKGNLDAHLLTHSADKPHSCSVCNKRFKTPLQLRKHESVHTGAKPHQCDVCGRQFRERGTLREHHRIHTGAMPFTCEYCGKAFRFKGILTTHRRQHTGERPYSCLECQHHFTNWPNYNKHMKRRHGINTSHQPDPNKMAGIHNTCIPSQTSHHIPPLQDNHHIYEEETDRGPPFYTQTSTNIASYVNNSITPSILGFYNIPQLQSIDPSSIDILHAIQHR